MTDRTSETRDLDVASCLEHWSGLKRDAIALVMLGDGERETYRVSYGELLQQAQMIAATLLVKFPRGAPVLLVFPTHPAFIAAFFGCLMAGMIAVPVPPNSRRQALARFLSIAANARPAAVLTLSALRDLLEPQTRTVSALASVPWLAIEEIESGSDRIEPRHDRLAPALLQYTSGSTSEPKGVVVTHAHLSANLQQMVAAFGNDEHACFVSWLPLFHDMGLIYMALQALFVGAKFVMMQPAAFLQRPARWIEALSRYRGTVSAAPNFAFDLCCDRIKTEQLNRFDLSDWTIAYSAAEPIRAATLARFAQHFAPAGFRAQALSPSYGLAEATVFVTGTPPGAGVTEIEVDVDAIAAGRLAPPGRRSKRLVGCGRPASTTDIVIVDPDTRRLLPNGRVGEVLVCGPQVPERYWNVRPEEDQVFQARIVGRDRPEERFLRTGDLGFLHDGGLFVTGRIKDLIIIRGTNLHPHDIETAVAASHPAFAADRGGAFGIEVDELEELVVVHEVDRHHVRKMPIQAMAEAAIEAVIRQFGVRLYDLVLLAPNALPRTTSGKIRRRQCREDYQTDRLVYACRPLDLAGLGRCCVLCDYVPHRSYPLLLAREVLQRLAAEFERRPARPN